MKTKTQGSTPGPWTLKDHAEVSFNDDVLVAECYRWSITVKTPTHDRSAEHEANARLIAASPDLLRCLKTLRDACADAYKSGRIDALAFVEAGNAIAKAEAA